jgi:predicted small secreted protein
MTRPILSILALLALAACETAEGFGQDVENTGEFIEEEAEQAQGTP